MGVLSEEERVERDGLRERHSDDPLHEDLGGGARIAADGLRGLEADETDSDGCSEAAEAALDASCHFSDY
jgi:hypothetical protein